MILDALQWPAMAATIIAAYLVGARSKHKRRLGFWTFIGSNVLWAVWGWHDGAYALVFLQAALFALNVRGSRRNE